jgi:hypothetical protein
VEVVAQKWVERREEKSAEKKTEECHNQSGVPWGEFTNRCVATARQSLDAHEIRAAPSTRPNCNATQSALSYTTMGSEDMTASEIAVVSDAMCGLVEWQSADVIDRHASGAEDAQRRRILKFAALRRCLGRQERGGSGGAKEKLAEQKRERERER